VERDRDSYSAELVEILLAAGANIHAPAAEVGGVTALQAAAKRGFVRLVGRFLQMGADVNAPRAQENGRTALEIAAEWGRIDMVKLLLNAGAVLGDPGFDYAQEKWFNAMSLAKDRGFRAVYNQIRDHFGLSDAQVKLHSFFWGRGRGILTNMISRLKIILIGPLRHQPRVMKIVRMIINTQPTRSHNLIKAQKIYSGR
jgi:ankyrin repeat protein